MKSGSAKHSAEERPSKATTSKKVFLKANGLILMIIIVDMVIISSGCAKAKGRRRDRRRSFNEAAFRAEFDS